jgi:hypothetical protein
MLLSADGIFILTHFPHDINYGKVLIHIIFEKSDNSDTLCLGGQK